MGFSPPNYTQTPNELFDYWLPKLKLVELRVLMVIFRKTFGWHKIRDRISLSQLEQLTGSHHQDIIKAVIKLESLGLVKKEVVGEKGHQKTFYDLVLKEDKNSNNTYQEESPPRNLLRGNSPSQKKPSSYEEVKEKEKREKENPPLICFGKYVKLKQASYDELVQEHGKDFIDFMINKINLHIDSEGRKPYKDYMATLQKWIPNERRSKSPPPNSVRPPRFEGEATTIGNWKPKYLIKEGE